MWGTRHFHRGGRARTLVLGIPVAATARCLPVRLAVARCIVVAQAGLTLPSAALWSSPSAGEERAWHD